MIKIWLVLCFAVSSLSAALLLVRRIQPPSAAAAEEKQAISNAEIDLLRRDIRSHGKQIIAQNVNLTDSEALACLGLGVDEDTVSLRKAISA